MLEQNVWSEHLKTFDQQQFFLQIKFSVSQQQVN